MFLNEIKLSTFKEVTNLDNLMKHVSKAYYLCRVSIQKHLIKSQVHGKNNKEHVCSSLYILGNSDIV